MDPSLVFAALESIGSIISGTSSIIMSRKEKKGLSKLIKGLCFLLQGKNLDAASEFEDISYRFNEWNSNYIMALSLAKACGGDNKSETLMVSYSKKAISLFEYLIDHIRDYKTEKDFDLKKARNEKKVELLYWLGRMKKILLFANQKRGTLTKDSDGSILLHGRSVLCKKCRLIRNYQEFIDTVFKTLEDAEKLAKENGFKQWEEKIQCHKALLHAMNNNIEEVLKIQRELCGVKNKNKQTIEYVSEEAQYIYERVRDRYNPEMAKNLIHRSQDE